MKLYTYKLRIAFYGNYTSIKNEKKSGKGSIIIDDKGLRKAYKLASTYGKELGEQAHQARLKTLLLALPGGGLNLSPAWKCSGNC